MTFQNNHTNVISKYSYLKGKLYKGFWVYIIYLKHLYPSFHKFRSKEALKKNLKYNTILYIKISW